MPYFHGSFTAIITPFTADGAAIDWSRLEANLHAQRAGGITGVVPAGTTGESPTLTEREHHELIERTIAIARPLGLKVIAGAGSNSTRHAVELHRFAAGAGADGALQVNPYYNKPSQEGLYRHFMAIADSADLPVMLYNVPPRTAVALLPETVARLAEHPNIVAIKEATGSLDSASEICLRCEIELLSGDDSMTLPFASVGGVGVVSVVSNLVPDQVSALCRAILAGEWATARDRHRELFALSKGLLSLDTNPIPIKTALKCLGRDSGALRLPMCEPKPGVVQSIERLLHDLAPALAHS